MIKLRRDEDMNTKNLSPRDLREIRGIKDTLSEMESSIQEFKRKYESPEIIENNNWVLTVYDIIEKETSLLRKLTKITGIETNML